MAVFLGVDIGSSSIKGAVLHPESGQVGRIVQAAFPPPVPDLPTGFFEVSPNDIVSATRKVLEDLSVGKESIEGIVFSSQMGGVLLADRHLNPLTRYLSWRDQRVLGAVENSGQSIFDELRDRTSSEILKATGNELRPGASVSLLYWLARTGSLPGQDAMALNLGDFVVARLCESEPVTEPTMALSSLDLRTGAVCHAWFEELGFGQLAWPAISAVSSPVGQITLGTSRVSCYPAVGDHQCSLLGTGLRQGELSLNISTGSQVSLLTSRLTTGAFQTRPFFNGLWLNTITHLPAGRSLNALVDLLCELSAAEGHAVQEPWPLIVRAVDRVEETDLEADLSFFAGSMGDHGRIGNVRLENLSVGHLFLAAFNNMADNYAKCALRLSPGKEWDQVVLSGGLAQKLPRLREVLATRFAGPMRSPESVDEALEGLLTLSREICRLPE